MSLKSAGQPKHKFSDEELDKMLYLWDQEASLGVHEYLYMKPSWVEGSEGRTSNGNSTSTADKVIDTAGNASVGVNNNTSADDNLLVFLDLDTTKSVHIVEFYAPWCPHCRALKPEFVKLAVELTKRSASPSVVVHAVSCELYRMICRAYDIDGYPFVMGFPLGANISQPGIQLNPWEGPEMTVETIAKTLNLNLTDIPGLSVGNLTNVTDEPLHRGLEAARRKHEWQTSSSTIDARYHNAAVSLIFALKDGVFVDSDKLDSRRAAAFRDFLQLLDWTTPQNWHVRSLVREILTNFEETIAGPQNLISLVERHTSFNTSDVLWGSLQVRPPAQLHGGLFSLNNLKWTESCTHSEKSLGYTCGLWNLFHILSIGASKPEHQLYGFHAGYLTAPADVAASLNRFVSNFFGCEVCRRNFNKNYDECGQNHCERLSNIIPALLGDAAAQTQAELELARWLLELHNAVNVRLMGEGAQREGRTISSAERKAAMFPPIELCDNCWLDEELEVYDEFQTTLFLKEWYWPANEDHNSQFQEMLGSWHPQRVVPAKEGFSLTPWVAAIVVLLAFLGFARKREYSHSKKL
eukprot:Nitzschia sp. Nitz4//scaffold62_size106224//75924//77663//NITZ4_004364-RA/size106224-processed-gene-0.36-mRNA-1//1//CDS//3329555880//7682//frame0